MKELTQTWPTMRLWILAVFLLLPLRPMLADDPVEASVRAQMQARLTEREVALSLEDCIKIALENNLDVQIRRLDPELAHFSLHAAYAPYDPAFSLSGTHSYQLSPGGLDDQNRAFSGTETEVDTINGGLSGLLPWGTRYSFGANLSDRYGTSPGALIDFNNFTLNTNVIYDIYTGTPSGFLVSTNYNTIPTRNPFESASANVGFFELRQPLLKNFWIDNTRLQIFLNRKNLENSELALRRQIINTITDVEQAYFNLIYTEETVKVQEKALELAERLVSENRRRVEVGALAPLDERQAESQAAASRADLLAAKANRDTQERVLKSLLSDDYESWNRTRIRPTGTLMAIPQHFDLQESWRTGVSMRPDLLQARIEVEKQTRIVRYQRNQKFPQLDVVGDIGYLGSDDEFSSAFRQVRRTDNSYYSYGVQFTMPIGNVAARNNLKIAKVTQEQLELQLKQLEQSVLISIENTIANARTSLERVEATRQARAYAEEALRAEETKLEKGKSTSFVVLQLQRDLTAARSAEIRALADYNIALAQLAESEGSTLIRRGIDLKVR